MVRRAYPVRTCVGCRKRAPASDLLRVVAVSHGDVTGASYDIVPDPARRMPGRGAHLHFDQACLAQAVRRRVFGRALRVAGIVGTETVEAYLTDGEAPKSSSGLQQVGRPV